jgi:hypothetical protein
VEMADIAAAAEAVDPSKPVRSVPGGGGAGGAGGGGGLRRVLAGLPCWPRAAGGAVQTAQAQITSAHSLHHSFLHAFLSHAHAPGMKQLKVPCVPLYYCTIVPLYHCTHCTIVPIVPLYHCTIVLPEFSRSVPPLPLKLCKDARARSARAIKFGRKTVRLFGLPLSELGLRTVVKQVGVLLVNGSLSLSLSHSHWLSLLHTPNGSLSHCQRLSPLSTALSMGSRSLSLSLSLTDLSLSLTALSGAAGQLLLPRHVRLLQHQVLLFIPTVHVQF